MDKKKNMHVGCLSTTWFVTCVYTALKRYFSLSVFPQHKKCCSIQLFKSSADHKYFMHPLLSVFCHCPTSEIRVNKQTEFFASLFSMIH